MIYTDENRGAIQFRERRKQLVDFSSLRIGRITPTDCDGLIEYHGKAYILFEIKHRDAKVPEGQLKALTRMIDALNHASKYAVLIIAEHNVDNPAEDINAADCKVRSWYDGRKQGCFNGTLKELVDICIARVDGRYI